MITLTSDKLLAIMPKTPKALLDKYCTELNNAMVLCEIDSPLRLCAFLAQLAHESYQFKYMEEVASGSAYEGRKDLGNTQKGDGKRFKGRGPIQVTGRGNYTTASKDLGVDLVNHPELAATPEYGFKIAAWFWKSRGLNALADVQDFRKITKLINGGYNGWEDRVKYYKRALALYGLTYNVQE